MKLLVRSFLLILACLMAFATTACRGDDDDDSADGDADSDGDSDADSDGDSDGDSDSDGDADGDADACEGENTDETCDDGQDNNANEFTDCTDNCCRHNADVTVCDATEPTPIQDVRNGEVSVGDQVLVENMIVTGIDRETSWYMQSADDGDPDFTGIFVFVPDSNPDDITIPSIGDIINVRGELDDFFDFAELTFVAEPEVVSTGTVEPIAVTPDEIGDEDGEAGARAEPLESMLVQVVGFVTNLAPEPGPEDNAPTNEFAIGDVADGDDLLRVDDHSFELDPMPAMGDHVTIIGNLRYNHGHFALEPRSQDDLTIE